MWSRRVCRCWNNPKPGMMEKLRAKLLKSKPRIPLQELNENVLKSQASAYAEGTLKNLTTSVGKIFNILYYPGGESVTSR